MVQPKGKLARGKKSDVTPALIDDKGGRHPIPESKMSADLAHMSNKTVPVDPAKHAWYDYVKPFVGIKWGAIVVLLAYNFFDGLNDPKLMWACIILGLFTFLEWLDLGIKDFRRYP